MNKLRLALWRMRTFGDDGKSSINAVYIDKLELSRADGASFISP